MLARSERGNSEKEEIEERIGNRIVGGGVMCYMG